MLRNLASHLGARAVTVADDEAEQTWEYGGDVGEEVFEFGELVRLVCAAKRAGCHHRSPQLHLNNLGVNYR
jgi:hypothetical protein